MKFTLYTYLSIALYLLPLVVVTLAQGFAHPKRKVLDFHTFVPVTTAVDFLSVLLLTRFVHLEYAIVAMRVLWTAGGCAYLARGAVRARAEGRRFALPWSPKTLAILATSVALGVFVSAYMAHLYRVWDRYWHIPLSASIAGQTVPFQNVYEPGIVFHYHWTGDVFAQMFQTLSFKHISSDVGLILVHDVSFGLIALVVASVVMTFGESRVMPPLLAALATVLQGPLPLRGGLGLHLDGYAYHNFETNSLRPHLGLAGVLMAGFVGAVAVRLADPDGSKRRTQAVLVASVALLGITDEPSTMMLLGGLGAAWLLDGKILGEKRLEGVLVILALGAAVLVPNLLFGASLSPGSPVQHVEYIRSGRIPGAHTEIPIFKLWSHEGNVVLFCDFFPFVACGVAILLFSLSSKGRSFLPATLFVATVTLLAFFGLTHVEINRTAAVEVQRYFVAPYFAAYLFALPLLSRMARGSVASLFVTIGAGLSALSTVFWLREQLPQELGYATVDKSWNAMMENTVTTDCKERTGATFGETPRPMYVESSVWYAWVGCHAVFAPGWHEQQWTIKTRPTGEGKAIEELQGIQRDLIKVGDTLAAACLVDPTRNDVVCARARKNSCKPSGSLFQVCSLTPEDRAALLR